MYWGIQAGNGKGTIVRAWMDGTHRAAIVTAYWPRGLKINFKDSRLYFATHKPGKKIMTSTFQGKDVKPAVSMLRGGFTYGIGFWNGRIYWSDSDLKALRSRAISGQDIKQVYKDQDALTHLTAVPRIYPTNKRENDCDKKNCPNICVLNPKTSSCVSEDGRIQYR